MRLRTITRGAFYTNDQQEKFEAGNLTLTSRDNDWWVYYTDENGDEWKIAPEGTDNATISPKLVDSLTTSIVVTPDPVVGDSGTTVELAIVNQTGLDVISECAITSDTTADVTVNDNVVTLINTGTAILTIAHPDITDTTVNVTVN
jgi:hypothetical protein